MYTSDGGGRPSTTTPKQYRIEVGQNGVNADGLLAMQATMLTALATDATVEVNFDNGSTNCFVNRIAIRR